MDRAANGVTDKRDVQQGKTDLLLRLFESPYFSEWLCVQYLYQSTSTGVQDYLCNRLYELPDQGIEKYLLEFVYLALARPASALERVLVSLCSRSFGIAIKVYWLLLALNQDQPRNRHVEFVKDRCERAALEGEWEVPFKDTRLDVQLGAHSGSPPLLQQQHSEGALSPASHYLSNFRKSFELPNGIAEAAQASRLEGSCNTDASSGPAGPAPAGRVLPVATHMEVMQSVIMEEVASPGGEAGAAGAGGPGAAPGSSGGAMSDRCEALRRELGDGEGVTALLARSTAEDGGRVTTAEEALSEPLPPSLTPMTQLRVDTFCATVDFMEALCNASSLLTRFALDERQRALRKGLEAINGEIEVASKSNVAIWFPLTTQKERIIRLASKEAVLLNSREKAPFMLFLEVLRMEDNADDCTSAAAQDERHNVEKAAAAPQANHRDDSAGSAGSLSASYRDSHGLSGESAVAGMRSTSPDIDSPFARSIQNTPSPQATSKPDTEGNYESGRAADRCLMSPIPSSTSPVHTTKKRSLGLSHSPLSMAHSYPSVTDVVSRLSGPPANATSAPPAALDSDGTRNSSFSAGSLASRIPILGNLTSSGSFAETLSSSRPSSKLKSLRASMMKSNGSFPDLNDRASVRDRWNASAKPLSVIDINASGTVPKDAPPSTIMKRLDTSRLSLRGDAPLVRLHISINDSPIGATNGDESVNDVHNQGESLQASFTGNTSRKTPGKSNDDNPHKRPEEDLKTGEDGLPQATRGPWLLSKFGWCKGLMVEGEDDEQGLKLCPWQNRCKLLRVRLEVAGGLNLNVTSPVRKSRRVPSFEAIDMMAGKFKVQQIPPPYDSGPPLQRPEESPHSARAPQPALDQLAQVKVDSAMVPPAALAAVPATQAQPRPAADSGPGAGPYSLPLHSVASVMVGALQATKALLSPEHPALQRASPPPVPAPPSAPSAPSGAAAREEAPPLRAAPHAAPVPQRQESAEDLARHSKEAKAVFGERWAQKQLRVQRESPYGWRANWGLQCVIVKSGDDCRQELLAVQMIRTFQEIFEEAGLPLYLRPFQVLVTSNRTALIELIPDSLSIHTIKCRSGPETSLSDHFFAKFVRHTPACLAAQRKFTESMAGYSLLTYLLQVKDRHNGNIMMNDEGRIVHIDFGFMLSNSPGGVNFEGAPFKLTREMLEIMDSNSEGRPSELFDYFKVLCIQGFLALRKHQDRVVYLVKSMSKSGLPCFKNPDRAVKNLEKRFHMNLTEVQCVQLVLGLISDSLDAWRTRQYDYYQRVLNGIL